MPEPDCQPSQEEFDDLERKLAVLEESYEVTCSRLKAHQSLQENSISVREFCRFLEDLAAELVRVAHLITEETEETEHSDPGPGGSCARKWTLDTALHRIRKIAGLALIMQGTTPRADVTLPYDIPGDRQ